MSHCEAEGVLRPTFRPTFSEPRCCLKGSEANLISALINKTGEPHHGIQQKTYAPHLQSCEEGSFTGCFHLLYWLESAVSGNSFNNIHQLAHTCSFTFCLQLNYRVTGQDQNPRKCWMIPKYLEYRIYAYKLWIHDHTICWYVVHKSQGDTRCVCSPLKIMVIVNGLIENELLVACLPFRSASQASLPPTVLATAENQGWWEKGISLMLQPGTFQTTSFKWLFHLDDSKSLQEEMRVSHKNWLLFIGFHGSSLYIFYKNFRFPVFFFIWGTAR